MDIRINCLLQCIRHCIHFPPHQNGSIKRIILELRKVNISSRIILAPKSRLILAIVEAGRILLLDFVDKRCWQIARLQNGKNSLAKVLLVQLYVHQSELSSFQLFLILGAKVKGQSCRPDDTLLLQCLYRRAQLFQRVFVHCLKIQISNLNT